MSPADPDARITKMKDGRTHLAHKAEHAVDLSSGAVLAIRLQPASDGDTDTIHRTLAEAQSAAREIKGLVSRRHRLRPYFAHCKTATSSRQHALIGDDLLDS